MVLKRRAEDKPDLSPHLGLCVAPPRVQDPSLDSPLDGFPLISRHRVKGIPHTVSTAGTHTASTVPRTVPVTPGGRYIYHSHSHITLLGQLYSTLEPVGLANAKFCVICCQEPRRGRSLYAPEGGVIQLSFGFSLSRHRSKLVPES